MRRLELGQGVKLQENPNVTGSVVDSKPGWAEIVHSTPAVICGARQWYHDDLVEGLANFELRWEERNDG